MKNFVDPLLWFLVLQTGILVFSACRGWRSASHFWKKAWLVLALSTAGLAVLSTPMVASSLERSLWIDEDMPAGTGVPEYIFVLGGGYLRGPSQDQDVLVTETIRRVMTGVSWWRDQKDATLVFCGVSGNTELRPPERLSRLMAELALCYGVPESNMLLESVSRNTREHPRAALRLPKISEHSSIGIVTSGWHMKRASREFRRYFAPVQIRSVPHYPLQTGWRALVPNAGSLYSSKLYLQEWTGMAWYALTSFNKSGSSPLRRRGADANRQRSSTI